MDRELQKEWQTLEEDALRSLRAPADPGSGYVPEAFALIAPSFDDCRAYTISRSRRDTGAPARGYLKIWRRATDLGKLETPLARLRHPGSLLPTIELSRVEIPLMSAKALIERIANAHVPPFVQREMFGTDGTSYELRFGQSFLTSEFRWWESPPDGWQPLDQILRDIQALVEGAG
jgi:hypothetical protein